MKRIVNSTSLKYLVSGAAFTVLGPVTFTSLFWLGPVTAFIASETLMHTARYFVISRYVFGDKKRFRVTILSYLVTIAPSSGLVLIYVGVMADILGKAVLVLTSAALSVIVGYSLSRIFFRRRGCHNNLW